MKTKFQILPIFESHYAEVQFCDSCFMYVATPGIRVILGVLCRVYIFHKFETL